MRNGAAGSTAAPHYASCSPSREKTTIIVVSCKFIKTYGVALGYSLCQKCVRKKKTEGCPKFKQIFWDSTPLGKIF